MRDEERVNEGVPRGGKHCDIAVVAGAVLMAVTIMVFNAVP